MPRCTNNADCFLEFNTLEHERAPDGCSTPIFEGSSTVDILSITFALEYSKTELLNLALSETAAIANYHLLLEIAIKDKRSRTKTRRRMKNKMMN